MIKLVLETPGSRWALRTVEDPPWPVTWSRPFATEGEAREDLARVSTGGVIYVNGKPYALEVYRLPERTEILSWPAKEDFDAWLLSREARFAAKKSVIKRKKRRPRIAKEHATAMGIPTAVVSAGTSTSVEVRVDTPFSYSTSSSIPTCSMGLTEVLDRMHLIEQKKERREKWERMEKQRLSAEKWIDL